MFRVAVLTILVSIGVPAFGVTVTTTACCTSAVPGITSTITFNGSNTTDPAGHATYSGTILFDGGTNPGGGGDWLDQNGSTTTVTFDLPLNYFGLLWGTPDSYNSLQLFNGLTQLGPTFTGSVVSNPYVNFFADAGEQFTRVVLSSPQCCYETDNHSYRLAASSGVPEPGTFFPAALAAAVWTLRRRRQKLG